MSERWELLLSDKVTSIFSLPEELLFFHLKIEVLNTDEACLQQNLSDEFLEIPFGFWNRHSNFQKG